MNKADCVGMTHFSNLHRRAGPVVLKFEKKPSERLPGQVFTERKPNDSGLVALVERGGREIDIIEDALCFRVKPRARSSQPGPPRRSLKQPDLKLSF